MFTLFAPKRMRRCIFAIVFPVSMSLVLVGAPSAILPRTHAQLPERIKAPELDGAVGTLGSDKPIKLKDLRGKIVVLEFWTLC
jgi:hypothetical protein